MRAICLGPVLAVAMLAAPEQAVAQGAELAVIQTPRGVKQRFAVTAPADPIASVILFTGGNGELELASATEMKRGAQSFLVRSRDKLLAHNVMVALIDVPSDRPGGMDASFRIGSAHAGDIGAVAGYLRKIADVPVWLVGVSTGTLSAAWGAIAADHVDGLVLASAVTRARAQWKLFETHAEGVASLALEDVTQPTLIVAHAEDGCDMAPADGIDKLKARLSNAKTLEIALLKGRPAEAQQPCGSMSAHGFGGVEAEAVDAIAKFIKANSTAPTTDK